MQATALINKYVNCILQCSCEIAFVSFSRALQIKCFYSSSVRKNAAFSPLLFRVQQSKCNVGQTPLFPEGQLNAALLRERTCL